MNSNSSLPTATRADKTVIVLLGTPHSPVDAFGEQLAAGSRGVYLGDLNLSLGRTVGDLLQVYELSQTPVHEPLFAFLRGHVAGAEADPGAFLSQRKDWSFAQLLQLLIDHAAGASVVFSDTSAGFRIGQVDRWLRALPQALFVHTLIARAKFGEAANQHYAGRLFVPPDFRDYCVLNKAPQFAPDLAWFQVHRTLSQALSEAPGIRHCRATIDGTDAQASLDVLMQRAVQPAAPFRKPADIAALEAALLGEPA